MTAGGKTKKSDKVVKKKATVEINISDFLKEMRRKAGKESNVNRDACKTRYY